MPKRRRNVPSPLLFVRFLFQIHIRLLAVFAADRLHGLNDVLPRGPGADIPENQRAVVGRILRRKPARALSQRLRLARRPAYRRRFIEYVQPVVAAMDIRSFQKRGKKLPVKAAADGNQFLLVHVHAKKIVRSGNLLRVIHRKGRVIDNLARPLFLPLLHPEQIFHPNRSKPPRAQPVEDFAAFAGIIPPRSRTGAAVLRRPRSRSA